MFAPDRMVRLILNFESINIGLEFELYLNLTRKNPESSVCVSILQFFKNLE